MPGKGTVNIDKTIISSCQGRFHIDERVGLVHAFSYVELARQQQVAGDGL